MKECSKTIMRRVSEGNFIRSYFIGHGIDIGGAPDPLILYQELFPLVESIKVWDIVDGDAQYMAGVVDRTFDFVHSSHCLEHMADPAIAMNNWLRILKPGGHMIVTVPDEDMYEQGRFPSIFNTDHKWSFTIKKSRSWSTRSVNVLDLLGSLGDEVDIRRILVHDSTYRYRLPCYDQTLSFVTDCSIEFILRRRLASEVEAGGRLPGNVQPSELVRIHLNQYREDRATIIKNNKNNPPFVNKNQL